LTATTAESPVGYDPLSATAAKAVLSPSTLQYFDGSNGVWWATSGTQSNAMTFGNPCPVVSATAASTAAKRPPSPVQCILASFAWAFSATVRPFPLPIAGNSAAGTPTIALGRSTASGPQ